MLHERWLLQLDRVPVMRQAMIFAVGGLLAAIIVAGILVHFWQ